MVVIPTLISSLLSSCVRLPANTRSYESGPNSKSERKKGRKAKHERSERKRPSGRAGPVRSGSSFLGRAGAFLGDTATKLIGKITGLGDYKIASNSLMGGMVPSFGGEMSTTFSRREFIGDVKSSVDFEVQSFPINPGMAVTCPWGSRVAANFEQYRLKGMLFEFKTTCGSAVSSTNNALGVVVMSTQYDPLEPPFQDKREMEAYVYTSSSVPSQSQVHAVECKPSLTAVNAQYLRAGGIPGGADLRLYDHGTFYIATVGMQAAGVTIGELWVTYHVELIKPRLLSPVQAFDQASSWTMASTNGSTATTAPTLYEYTDSKFATVTSDTNYARITFAPYVVGRFHVTTWTYSNTTVASDSVSHLGWRGGTADIYLGSSGLGSIAWLTDGQMQEMFGGNWASYSLSPQNSSMLFHVTNTAQPTGNGSAQLTVCTTQMVSVQNDAGGTCWVRSPVVGTSLNCTTLIVVERVSDVGFSSLSLRKRVRARLVAVEPRESDGKECPEDKRGWCKI